MALENTFTVQNCYDSHVHWLATGQSEYRVALKGLQLDQIRAIVPQKKYFRGDWLFGSGWDENIWPDKKMPTRHDLDIFAFPVIFWRADQHALWVNTPGLKKCGLFGKINFNKPGGKVLLGADELPSGIFVDLACDLVTKHVPAFSAELIPEALMSAGKYFNRRGFTHIRDMTCDPIQWNSVVAIDKQLTIAVEQNFNADDPQNYQSAVELALRARKENLLNVRPQGLKIYYDGALGSEGALLSQNYHGSCNHGLRIIPNDLLAEILNFTWEKDLPVAVHVIGDEAAHQVVKIANEVWQKTDRGYLHLEHAEMIRPETIAMMKGRRIICHMQPCHWLTDKSFLKNKLGPLIKYVFPWRQLEENKIDFDFGSDSPKIGRAHV